jgi:hypothetical protein
MARLSLPNCPSIPHHKSGAGARPAGAGPAPGHLIAYGLIGVPTPRVTGSGGATSRKA